MNSRFHRMGIVAAVTLATGMLATGAFAQAQSPAQQQAPAQATTAAPNTGPAPTDTELKQFALAATDVGNIRKAEQPKIAAAPSADARTQLKQATEQKMEAAVRSHHLSIHRYEQIAEVVQTNSAVRAKVLKLMEQPTKS